MQAGEISSQSFLTKGTTGSKSGTTKPWLYTKWATAWLII